VHEGKIQKSDIFKFKTGGLLKSRQFIFPFSVEDAVIFSGI